jgi:hypothetical protein
MRKNPQIFKSLLWKQGAWRDCQTALKKPQRFQTLILKGRGHEFFLSKRYIEIEIFAKHRPILNAS